jgi:hypothetical protein
MLVRILFTLLLIAAHGAPGVAQAQRLSDHSVVCDACGTRSTAMGRHDFCVLNAETSGGPNSRCRVSQAAQGEWLLTAQDPFADTRGQGQACHAICITYAPHGRPQPSGRYELVVVPGGIDFPGARQRARAMGGHLATITSAAELATVWQVVDRPDAWLSRGGNLHGPWLGGLQRRADRPWRWITGEAWSFDNWAPGQPDNYLGVEDRLHFFTAGPVRVPTWNDAPGDFRAPGFVVEY